jgi:hypothetical protein
MFNRFRPSIGSAHVIATIALFVALGGGYATAFSGSGTLQKSATTYPAVVENYVPVRTLTGIGSIDARCQTGDTTPELRVTNNSGKDLILRYLADEVGAVSGQLENDRVNNGQSQELSLPNAASEVSIRLYPHGSGGKAPQIDGVIDVTDSENCFNSGAQVVTMILNTQQ